jgi:nucleoid-associated protein YgaU
VDSGIEDDELLDASELDPALAMPSPRVYRGSLLALLIGSLFAGWLLVLPPVGADKDQPPASISGIISGAVPTATPTADPTITTTATPKPTSTPAATSTPELITEPTATAASVEVITYTVRSGDTMFAIAALHLPVGKDLDQFADEIAAVNGIEDLAQIQSGQVLDIPGQ